jgi:hypothetical protein
MVVGAGGPGKNFPLPGKLVHMAAIFAGRAERVE